MMIRKALPYEAQDVLDLYHSVIDGMANSPYKPKWQKGIYPTIDDISSAISNKELYIALSEDDAVSGAVILRHESEAGYENVFCGLDTQNYSVVHLLAVSPTKQRSGIARALLDAARDSARENGSEAIRLDTLPYNTPAQRLYESFGFQYKGEVELYYTVTGNTAYKMYEYLF